MRQITIGNVTETVVERADFPPERIKQILANETVAVLGYGVQGRGQSLNMKDNGVRVIVGQRQGGKTWDLAQQDGWEPGKTLFSMDEAAQRGTVVRAKDAGADCRATGVGIASGERQDARADLVQPPRSV